MDATDCAAGDPPADDESLDQARCAEQKAAGQREDAVGNDKDEASAEMAAGSGTTRAGRRNPTVAMGHRDGLADQQT